MSNYFKLTQSSGVIRPTEVEKFLDVLASEAGARYDKNLGISERLFFEQQAGARIGAYIQYKTEVSYPIYRDEVLRHNEEQRERNVRSGMPVGKFFKEITPKENYLSNIQREVISQVEEYKKSGRFERAFSSGIEMRSELEKQHGTNREGAVARNPFLDMKNQLNPIGKLLKMGFAVSYAVGVASLRTVQDLKQGLETLRNHYGASREKILATAAKLNSSAVQEQVQMLKKDFQRPAINGSKKNEQWEAHAVSSPTVSASKGLNM